MLRKFYSITKLISRFRQKVHWFQFVFILPKTATTFFPTQYYANTRSSSSPYSFRSQKIWCSEKKNVSGCKPTIDTFWNRWRCWSAGRTDSSSRRKTRLRTALGRSWPRAKIRPLYLILHISLLLLIFPSPFFFSSSPSLSLFSCRRSSRKISLLPPQTIQSLREKVNTAAESASRQSELIEATVAKTRSLDAERLELEGKVRKMEAQLTDCELAKERSRRDKQTVDKNISRKEFFSPSLCKFCSSLSFQFVTFLDRLGKAMQMDEITEEMGIDLQTESLLVRGEQLARLESDKLVDKVQGGGGRWNIFRSRANFAGFASRSEAISLIFCLSVCSLRLFANCFGPAHHPLAEDSARAILPRHSSHRETSKASFSEPSIFFVRGKHFSFNETRYICIY